MNKNICKFCNSNSGKLFQISGSVEFICEKCLDERYSQYDLCSDCNIVYDDSNLSEGNDGKFYCKDHIINHQGKLSKGEKDLIDKINKD